MKSLCYLSVFSFLFLLSSPLFAQTVPPEKPPYQADNTNPVIPSEPTARDEVPLPKGLPPVLPKQKSHKQNNSDNDSFPSDNETQTSKSLPLSGTLESIPSSLISEALAVNIVVSLGKNDDTNFWKASDVKYTIPGTAFTVKLTGTETAVLVTVTPYKNRDGLLLVTQGQIWYKNGDGFNYRTTMESLSVNFGEKVYYYPFGNNKDAMSLCVELRLDKYNDKKDANAQQESKAESAP